MLTISCCESTVVDGLRTLVAANPFLSQVKIHVSGLEFEVDANGDVENVGDNALAQPTTLPNEDGVLPICVILRVLHSCSHLRELMIDSDPSVRIHWAFLSAVHEMLSDYFRRRRIHLQVLGVDYLPIKRQSE